MGASIPIQLTPIPCPYGITGMSANDLLNLVSQFMAGQINLSSVSFFQQGTVDPTTNIGIFYNQAQQLFKAWDTGTGRYLPVGLSVQAGDTKVTFISGDEAAQGWIVLDGRLLTAVTGISQNQFNVLQILFGTASNASLPNWTAIGAFNGIPAQGSASNVSIPTWNPPVGQIGALTFSQPPMQSEVQGLAQNAEQLDDSGYALTGAVTQLQTVLEQLIDALNTTNSTSATTTPAYCKLYVGPP